MNALFVIGTFSIVALSILAGALIYEIFDDTSGICMAIVIAIAIAASSSLYYTGYTYTPISNFEYHKFSDRVIAIVDGEVSISTDIKIYNNLNKVCISRPYNLYKYYVPGRDFVYCEEEKK